MRAPHDDETTRDSPEARFGLQLRRLRERAGLTVRRLAQELHRSHSTIVEYERGRRLPALEVVEQYEDYFGLDRGALTVQRERARLERLVDPADGTIADHLGDDACPYMGLRAFQYEDADLFFGREDHVERVLARLARMRFVAVVGPSGSGKSSFVRAGLLANIRDARRTIAPRVALLTPGPHPVEELATAVSAAIGAPRAVTAPALRADVARLGIAARESCPGGLVIAVDQFEELFTLTLDEDERRRFVDALVGAWRDPTSPVAVIVTLRADFYGRIAGHPELAAAVVAHQALIGPMSEVDLRRAIELPAARSGLVLQPGLTDTILEDLAGEPGALPLLSHALLETWHHRQRLMLTVGGYRDAGGVRGAIAQTAERTLHSLAEGDRATARSIFLRLTDIRDSTEPARRRVDREELAAHPLAARSQDRVLGILADARLVTIDERSVTIAHESLVRHWPRLRGWVDADREALLIHRRLSDAASEWESLGREPSAVYRGTRLTAAMEWANEHEDEVSRVEREFLDAGDAADRRKLMVVRRATSRLRALAFGLAGLSVVVAALAAWALAQRGDARRQSMQATALALASAATSVIDSRPDVSLLLAFEAYRASPRVETQSSVLSALSAARDPGVVAILHGHPDTVTSVAFSPDGRLLACASVGKTIQLWDVRSRRPVGEPLAGHAATVSSVAFSPDGRTLVSGSEDGTVRLWDVRTRRQRGSPLAGHTDAVLGVASSRDGRTIASASADHTVRLWDVRTHEPLGRPLTDHVASVVAVAFSPDGRTLASGGGDALRLWDVRSGDRRASPKAGVPLRGGRGTWESSASDIAFSPDGRSIAAVGVGRTIRIWDVRARRQRGRPLEGHGDIVSGVAFAPDGRTLATAGADRAIRLWDVRTRRQLGRALTGHTDIVGPLEFSPDGRTLASSSTDKTVRLWDAAAILRGPAGHGRSVASLSFSPDGRTLASGSSDGAVRLWDASTVAPVGDALDGHDATVLSVAFTRDGSMLAAAGDARAITLWDVRTSKPLGELRGHAGPVRAVAFHPNGRLLASGGDTTVRLWDPLRRRQIGGPLTGHALGVSTVAFDRSGHTLASAAADTTIRLWDPTARKQLGRPLTGHTNYVDSVMFASDGRTLVSAAEDNTARVWDVRTHAQRGPPVAVEGGVAALSPDGRMLAVAGHRAVRLVDLATRKHVGAPLPGSSSVVSVTFSPDGRTLAAGSADGTIHLWKGWFWRDLDDLRRTVCTLAGGSLNPSEWAQYAPGIAHRTSCA